MDKLQLVSLIGGASSPGGDASSLGGDASPRRHLLDKARCLDKQIHKYPYFKYCQFWASSPKLAMPTRGRVAPK
nr:MAG TPA: hypothetical protein [Caudoviricetes sp.]